MGRRSSRKSLFVLDNNPLRVLALGEKHLACDSSNLISILTKEGFFSPSARLLLPVFVTLEFLGVKTKKLPRPDIDVNSLGPSLALRMQGAFDQAFRFFNESAVLSQQALISYWVARNNYRVSTPLAEDIFRAVWDRILKPGFRDELCCCLAADELSRAPFGEFMVTDTSSSENARCDVEREMRRNTEVLRCLIEIRERLGISIPVARIVNRIWRSGFRTDVWVPSDKGKQSLVEVAKFREREDGADMEYIDFSLLGSKGRPVTCVTFDSFHQVALRTAAARYWYKRFLARHGKLHSLANVSLVDGCILQITDNQVRRISPKLLPVSDIPFEGL